MCSVYVELQGEHSRGMVAVDHYGTAVHAPPQERGHGDVVVVQKIDQEIVLREIKKVLYCPTAQTLASNARRSE